MWWNNIGNHPAFPQSSKLKPPPWYQMLYSSRWCPVDDLTASTLLVNISRIIFLHFQGDWHCQLKPTMSQMTISSTNSNQQSISAPCPSSVYHLVRGLLPTSPSPSGRYRQSNSIPGVSTSFSFFKIKTFSLDAKFNFLQGSVNSTPNTVSTLLVDISRIIFQNF